MVHRILFLIFFWVYSITGFVFYYLAYISHKQCSTSMEIISVSDNEIFDLGPDICSNFNDEAIITGIHEIYGVCYKNRIFIVSFLGSIVILLLVPSIISAKDLNMNLTKVALLENHINKTEEVARIIKNKKEIRLENYTRGFENLIISAIQALLLKKLFNNESQKIQSSSSSTQIVKIHEIDKILIVSFCALNFPIFISSAKNIGNTIINGTTKVINNLKLRGGASFFERRGMKDEEMFRCVADFMNNDQIYALSVYILFQAVKDNEGKNRINKNIWKHKFESLIQFLRKNRASIITIGLLISSSFMLWHIHSNNALRLKIYKIAQSITTIFFGEKIIEQVNNQKLEELENIELVTNKNDPNDLEITEGELPLSAKEMQIQTTVKRLDENF